MSKKSLSVSYLMMCLLAYPVYAMKHPHSVSTDVRIKQVAYTPEQVYEVVGTYGYQTSIEFAKDEKIKVVTLGDSIAWQTVPYQNRLFLKPVEPNAATNLTVITDKRTYYFNLISSRKKSTVVYLVKFIYPNVDMVIHTAAKADTQADKPADKLNINNLNLDYGFSGDKAAIPLSKVFDDGQFTYFRFKPDTEIPTIYVVEPDGKESIVNTRREGQYLVVEQTASLFTLRNGDQSLCVQNNAKPYKRAEAKSSEAS